MSGAARTGRRPARGTSRALLPIALLAIGATTACADPAPDPEADEREIASLIGAVETANNAGDVDGWVDLFAEGAVYLPPGGPSVTTRDELVEVARAGFRHRADVSIRPLEIQVAGDWAFARNAVTGTVTLAGSGEVIPVDVRQLVIYTREDGTWRIARMIANRSS